jgi:signal peptidase II
MAASAAEPSDPPKPPAGVNRFGWTAYVIAVVALILDQAFKWWVVEIYDLPARRSVPVFGPFNLTWVLNDGVSFGMLSAEQDLMRWALVAFSLIVAAALAWWARRPERLIVGAGLGLIIGGAVGNAIDRFRLGSVIDFFDASRLYFPWVFNTADSAITVGVVLLLLDSVRKDAAPAPLG